jgi:hypothetical protein
MLDCMRPLMFRRSRSKCISRWKYGIPGAGTVAQDMRFLCMRSIEVHAVFDRRSIAFRPGPFRSKTWPSVVATFAGCKMVFITSPCLPRLSLQAISLKLAQSLLIPSATRKDACFLHRPRRLRHPRPTTPWSICPRLRQPDQDRRQVLPRLGPQLLLPDQPSSRSRLVDNSSRLWFRKSLDQYTSLSEA